MSAIRIKLHQPGTTLYYYIIMWDSRTPSHHTSSRPSSAALTQFSTSRVNIGGGREGEPGSSCGCWDELPMESWLGILVWARQTGSEREGESGGGGDGGGSGYWCAEYDVTFQLYPSAFSLRTFLPLLPPVSDLAHVPSCGSCPTSSPPPPPPLTSLLPPPSPSPSISPPPFSTTTTSATAAALKITWHVNNSQQKKNC